MGSLVPQPLSATVRGLGLPSVGGTGRGAVVGDVEADDPDPVILTHGYMDSHVTPWWQVLEGHLVDAGWPADRVYNVDVYDYPGLTVGSPRDYATEVQRELEVAHDEHGRPVDVVCHSMGGLKTRWCVEQGAGADYVDDIVTLGTPHKGTYAAYLGLFSAGGRDVRPGSGFIRTLNETGLEPSVRYTALYSSRDPLIRPARMGRIPDDVMDEDTENVRTGSQGHIELIHDPEVFGMYVDRLR